MKNDVIDNLKIIAKNLKKLRQIKEITVKDLSKRSSVSVSMISQIENLKQKPSVLTLRKILKALDYSLTLFVSNTQDEIKEFDYEPLELVQNKFKRLLLSGDRNATKMELLRPTLNPNDLALVEINMLPDCRLFQEPVKTEGKITGYVISGQLLIEFSNDEYIVQQGEEFQFDGNKPFNLRNFTDSKNVFLINYKAIEF